MTIRVNAPFSRPIVIAGLVIAAALVVGCGHRSTPVPQSTGFDGGVTGLDQFDPVTYFDAWSGDPSFPLPQFPQVAITQEEWQRLVAKERNVGLAKLSDHERQTLLSGGVKAYLTLVSNAEKHYIADGMGTEDTVERYHAEKGLNVILDAMDAKASSAEFDFAGNVHATDGDAATKFFARPPGSIGADESWSAGADGVWRCNEVYASEGQEFAALLYLGRLLTIGGTYRASVMYSGRKAIVIEGSGTASGQFIWIDQTSLFPIGLRLPSDTAGIGLTEPSREIQLVSVNANKPIERPTGTCKPQ